MKTTPRVLQDLLYFVKQVPILWWKTERLQFLFKLNHILLRIPKFYEFTNVLAIFANLNGFYQFYKK
jgi:hypothetical protein